MSKVITLSLSKVSFEKIIKGSDRNKILGKVVKAYHDGSSFTECEVEDTLSGLGLTVVLKAKDEKVTQESNEPVRYKGFYLNSGFAIIIGKMSDFGTGSFDELRGYESFLDQLYEPVEKFKTGIEIKFSAATALRLKSVIGVLKDKEAGLSAFIGKKKIFGSSQLKEKNSVFQRTNVEEMAEKGLTFRIDEKFMLTIIDMFGTVGSELFRIANGVVTLLDFSGFKAKMKVLEKEANKREEELNK